MNFPLNPPWECKQLRDAGGHPEYILRFQQTFFLEDLGEKKETQNEPVLTIIFLKASL